VPLGGHRIDGWLLTVNLSPLAFPNNAGSRTILAGIRERQPGPSTCPPTKPMTNSA